MIVIHFFTRPYLKVIKIKKKLNKNMQGVYFFTHSLIKDKKMKKNKIK
jgi:hypothetical protein